MGQHSGKLTPDPTEQFKDHILAHFEQPYHQGERPNLGCVQNARNPACGDEVRLQLSMDADGRIAEAWFTGCGCIVSQAAASILCRHVEGRTTFELGMLTPEEVLALLRVPLTPGRRRCALLPYECLHRILADQQ